MINFTFSLPFFLSRLFKAGGGRVINIQDYRKRKDELTFILVDNPDQTHIPLKSPTVPLLRINYIHNVVLEVSRHYFGTIFKATIIWLGVSIILRVLARPNSTCLN